MTADLVTVAAFVVVIVAAWYVLGRVEAHLLRTGARHPAQDDGTRLLPVWHLPEQGTAMSDEEFFVHLARLGVRDQLLDVAREVDAGLAPVPDEVHELRRRGAR